MQLYAITERRFLADGQDLLDLVQNWTTGGVQFLQLREKDLSVTQLLALTADIRARIDPKQTKLLVNLASPDYAAAALAAGADGVHLAGKPTAGAIAAARSAFAGRCAILSLPCHTLDEVNLAREQKADLILFSPIFAKSSAAPQGLQSLHAACAMAQPTPVFALGGVTAENAAGCLQAGAAGVAGIRLFLDDSWRRLSGPNHI